MSNSNVSSTSELINFDNLKVCHVNINSLRANFNKLQFFLRDHFFHIIALSETWIYSEELDPALRLDNYNFFNIGREDKTGGGAGAYIHSSLKCKLLQSSSRAFTNSPEFIILEISAPDLTPLLFSNVYRRPQAGDFNSFHDAITGFLPLYRGTIITGDFNFNLLNDSSEASRFRNFSDSLNLFIVPFVPTHHSFHPQYTGTWIDHIIIDNSLRLISSSQTGAPFAGGHELIQITYDSRIPRDPPKTLTARSFRNFNLADFHLTLLNSDWSNFRHPSDCDDLQRTLTTHLISALDLHAPRLSFTPKRPPAPWINPELKQLMRERNAAHHKARRTGNLVDIARYRDLRRLASSQLDQSKETYCLDRLGACHNNKDTWKELRSLNLAKKKPVNSLNHSPSEINDFFASVCNRDLDDEPELPNSRDLPFNDSLFHFKDITQEDLTECVGACKSNAEGVDRLSISHIKKALPAIYTFLLILFNFSLQHAIFPIEWKKALVVPLPKIKSPVALSDYRPIALLCCFGKLLERIVYNQVISYLELHNLLDRFQSGFKKHFSTQTALIKITDDIRLATDRRMITILVLFDFSKAFDTVSHSILLNKLVHFGFSLSVINWFKSYLFHRVQSIIDGGIAVTDWLGLACGVPQGSVLGPLLFSLFINDIGRVLRYCKYMLFADDLQTYYHCYPSDFDSAIKLVNDDIQAISTWAKANHLNLNLGKTKWMIFGSAPFVNKFYNTPDLPSLSLNGHPIPLVRETINLGVTLDSTLSWHKHIHNVIKKSNSNLGYIKYISNSLTFSLKKQLVQSMALSHFNYCSAVYNDLPLTLNLRIERAVNSAIRFLYKVRRDSHISPYRRKLGWLTVKARRSYFIGSITYSVLKTKQPLYLFELFENSLLPDNRTRRGDECFRIPLCRLETYSNSFLVTAIKLWNSLPMDIRDSRSIKIFNRRLKTYLLEIESEDNI